MKKPFHRPLAHPANPTPGIVERFKPGEFERVESVLHDLRALGVKELRTAVSWADWYASEGAGWYAWLFSTLAKEVNVLPCFVHTPPCLGVVPKFSSPPETPKFFADFVDVMITRFGGYFEWAELWDKPGVAHFLIRALSGKPLIVYGDGMQVRDVLFVEDLVDAFLLAQANIHSLSGETFDIGGGAGNTLSLLELPELIGEIHGSRPEVRMESWRCAGQRYFVADTRKFKGATGWSPRVNARKGVERLYRWLQEASKPASPLPLSADGGVYAILPH